jgi:hypothetical protein
MSINPMKIPITALKTYTVISMTDGPITIHAPSLTLAWFLADFRDLTPIQIYKGTLDTSLN